MTWPMLRTSMLTQSCTCIDMCFVSDHTITKVLKLNTATAAGAEAHRGLMCRKAWQARVR